jgi:hypothetical protein
VSVTGKGLLPGLIRGPGDGRRRLAGPADASRIGRPIRFSTGQVRPRFPPFAR